jgi:hypothetical protein
MCTERNKLSWNKLTPCSNTNRPSNSPNLSLLEITWMRNEPQIQPARLRQKPRHIFSAKTVPQAANPQLAAHILNRRRNDAVDFRRPMQRKPVSQVQAGLLLLDRNGVAGKQVGHDDEVVICCERVCEKLVLKKGDAEYVGDVEEGFGGRVGAGRVGDVRVDF